MGHDMAPMASAVANAYKERAIGLARKRERFWGPQLPGGGVIHVRAHIGTLGLAAAVAERNKARW